MFSATRYQEEISEIYRVLYKIASEYGDFEYIDVIKSDVRKDVATGFLTNESALNF